MRFLSVLTVLVPGALGCIRVHSNIENSDSYYHYEIDIFDNNDFHCKTKGSYPANSGIWGSSCTNGKYRYEWITTGNTGFGGHIIQYEVATGTEGTLCSCLTNYMINN
jgi:hypothetical protein